MVTQEKQAEPEPKLSRQQKRAMWREFEKMKKGGKDALASKVLWKIIMDNGGTISLPYSDVADIHPTAALQSVYVPDTGLIAITAGYAQPKSKIVQKDKRIITP